MELKLNKRIGVYKGNYNQEHCLSTVFVNTSHGGLTKKSEYGCVTIPELNIEVCLIGLTTQSRLKVLPGQGVGPHTKTSGSRDSSPR
jgi:hypothetical protein